jgi:CelD/BcsL family acetyltransferase involved in cellulose biosynthesis
MLNAPSITDNYDHAKDLKIKIYNNIDSLEEIQDHWNELLSEAVFPNIFLTWQWINSWWKFFGKDQQLYIAVFEVKSSLIAILPFQICSISYFPGIKFRKACLIGDGRIVSPDYLGPIIREGSTEYIPDIINVIRGVLSETRIVQFSSINIKDQSIEKIISALTADFPIFFEANDTCPIATFSGNYEEYFKNLSNTSQKKLNRKMKKAEKELDVRFECLSSEDCAQDILCLIKQIFKNSTRGKSGGFSFSIPQYQDFHREIIPSFARAGWLRFFILYFNNEPVCYIYGYYYNKIFWFYQTSFDLKYSKFAPGLIAFQLAIKHLIMEGAEQFDFLRGDEPYKFLFSDKQNSLCTITFFRNKGIYYFFFKTFKAIKMLKHKLITKLLKLSTNEKNNN